MSSTAYSSSNVPSGRGVTYLLSTVSEMDPPHVPVGEITTVKVTGL